MKTLTFLFFVLTFNLIAQEKPTLKVNVGHFGSVLSVCYSPDGKYALSGSYDNTIKLWEVSSGKEIKTLFGHKASINSVCYSPDGKKVLSASEDNTIKLWEISTGKEIRTFSHTGDKTYFTSVCFSPDGKLALSGSFDKKIRLWDISTGKEIKTFTGHTDVVSSVCFSPNGKQVLSGSWDKTLKLWDISTKKLLRTFSGHNERVTSVCFSPDSKQALSGSMYYTLKLWDISTGKEIKTFSGHSNTSGAAWETIITSVCFSPDGKQALSGSKDHNLQLWDISTGKEINFFSGHSNMVHFVCISPDGKQALSGSEDHTLKIWDISTGKNLQTLTGQSESVNSVKYSPDGKYFLSGDGDKTLKLWDISTGKEVRSFIGHSDVINSVCFSPDGKYALSGSHDKTMKLWDISTGKEIRTFSGNLGEITSVNISPDGKYALSGDWNQTVKLWDISTGKEIRTFSGHTAWVYSVCFSPDGKQVLSGSSDKTIKLWDVSTGNEVKTFSWFSEIILSVCFSSDGKYFLSGGGDGSIKLWDISTGEVIKFFSGYYENVYSVSFSPDNKQVLTSGDKGTLRLWDVSTGRVLKTFSGHIGCVNSSCFSPDGKKVISGSRDKSIKIWDVNTGNEILSLFSNSNDWSTVTPDMYFDCSNGGSQLASMILNNHGYNIDQFALKYNRPDIILQRLENKDSSLIQYCNNLYKKRLRKAGFTEEQLSSEIHVPIATITNSRQEGKFISLSFNLNDDKFLLKIYNIYINDVPIFGTYGKDISGKNNLVLTENIEICNGLNKIEISCINEKGAESFRALTYADYKDNVKGDLYFLGFGVSKYKNPSLNLEYADKDSKDLASVFEKMKGSQFTNTFIRTLTNEEVTPDNIKKAKEFIKNAKPDDTFVLFIAGHGMHDNDKEATYYFLTHNADPKNLRNTAADFETIEDLLQGIAPRNKLFLMDACESGEIDDDVQTNFIAQADQKGIKSRGMKTVTTSVIASETKQSKRSYLYEKDRFIYNDLSRRSGAIVFSSSKGGEFSYERGDIQNGLFTKSIINALASSVADKNNDGIISTDELRDFVSSDVAKTSNDLQHPTVDRDNIYQKFGFVVVK